MPYINFKEETFKGKKQLNNRKKNNIKVKEEIEKNKKSLVIQPSIKWSFSSFKKKILNNVKTESKESFLCICNEVIVCSRFENCKFNNISFKGCTFIGCYFEECDFGGGGVIFENCSFYLESIIKIPDLNKKDNLSCEFVRCTIYAEFISSYLNYTIFEDCFIKETAFELSDMSSVIVINSKLKKINLSDVDLSGAKFIENYLQDFEFNDKLKSKVDEKTFFDKIYPRKKTKAEYEGIYMVYETLADIFSTNNLKNNFGEYYYQCKVMERKSLDKIKTKVGSWMYWALCGYGERVLHTLVTSIVIMVIFAFLYLIFGLKLEEREIIYIIGRGLPINFLEFLSHINEALNLSVGTFAGVGANNCYPIASTYMLANGEIIIGAIMMGIGVGTVVRKLIR